MMSCTVLSIAWSICNPYIWSLLVPRQQYAKTPRLAYVPLVTLSEVEDAGPAHQATSARASPQQHGLHPGNAAPTCAGLQVAHSAFASAHGPCVHFPGSTQHCAAADR